MAHVFISYKREDNPIFINNLRKELEEKDFSVNIDTDILSGEKWSDAIEMMIHQSFAVILVITSNAMQSEWVNFEWAFALGTGAKVITIILDKKTKLPERLKSIQNLNFYHDENWKKLIGDLEKQYAKTWSKYWIPNDTLALIRVALEGLVETDNSDELNAFMTILSKHRDKNSVKALINGLKSPDLIIRAKSAWTLGTIQDADTIEPLIAALTENTEPVVIAHIIGALGHIGDKRALSYLRLLLQDQSVFSSLTRQPYRQDTISNQALMALNLIGTPEALTAVEVWKQENKPT